MITSMISNGRESIPIVTARKARAICWKRLSASAASTRGDLIILTGLIITSILPIWSESAYFFCTGRTGFIFIIIFLPIISNILLPFSSIYPIIANQRLIFIFHSNNFYLINIITFLLLFIKSFCYFFVTFF